jgi:hypothetical protein
MTKAKPNAVVSTEPPSIPIRQTRHSSPLSAARQPGDAGKDRLKLVLDISEVGTGLIGGAKREPDVFVGYARMLTEDG